MSHRRFAFKFFLGPQKGLTPLEKIVNKKRSSLTGLTFLEVIIAITLNAVAFLGLFQIFNVALNINQRSSQELIATNLARGLMNEIMTRAFVDPQDPGNTALGPNGAGETGRSTYDDVDDYAGYSDAPPKMLDDSVMDGVGGRPNYSNFHRSVSVVYCQVQGTSIVPSVPPGTPTNMKMITVTVSGPDFNPVSIVEILSNIP